MVGRSYTTTGQAYAGAAFLGRAHLYLSYLHFDEERSAKGAILFGEEFYEDVRGGRIRFVPDDGSEPFDLRVERISGGCATVIVSGELPEQD